MFKRLSALAMFGAMTAAALQPMQVEAYGADCCDCDCCDRFWVDAEYLYWEIQHSPSTPPLVVEGPVVPFGAPTLGQPGTNVVLGCDRFKNDWRSGGRFALGYWFDDCKCWGAEVNYFFLPTRTRSKSVFSDGSADSEFLSIPYFNVVTGSESSTELALPGVFSGAAVLSYKNSMQGAEINLVKPVPYDCDVTFGLLAGFRWWNYDDHLAFDTSSPFVPPLVPDVWMTSDKFHTVNNFYGGQIGACFDWKYGCFIFNAKAKVALGAMCRSADIRGTFVTNDFDGFGDPVAFEGGYFALPSNIGRHNSTNFSVLPEINVNLAYEFTDCVRVKVGYNFLYASNILWASKLIDRDIDPRQAASLQLPLPLVTGATAPSAKTKSDGIWAQGVSAGLEFRF